ncbi:MAG: tetratricopeptide repeat protein, partial [Verrucomicrobiota bacterium]
NSDYPYWPELLGYLRFQKRLLLLPFSELAVLRFRLFMIAMTSVVPVLMIGIRWPSFQGDTSQASGVVTAFVFRLMHLFFLAICIAVFLDYGYSARVLGYEVFPFLTFYYLTALAVGYFISYALLVFGREPEKSWKRSRGAMKAVNPVILALVGVGVVVVPVLLVQKNFPAIRSGNDKIIQRFAENTAASLPTANAVILSDDPSRIYLLKAIYAKEGKKNKNILLESTSLLSPGYHTFLYKQHPNEWPLSTNTLTEPALLTLLESLHPLHSIYYLHPSFGYYFERFYPVPHKLVYELKLYPPNTLEAPDQSQFVIKENQNFWDDFIKNEQPLLTRYSFTNKSVGVILVQYARALNFWGVEMQQAHLLKEAGQDFAAASALNPNNVAALINRDFNVPLQKGEMRPVVMDEKMKKSIAQYRTWEMLLSWNGPFDEPNFSAQTGEIFARGGNLRQSAQYFLRSLELSPKNLPATLGLIKTYIEMGQSDEATKLVKQVRESADYSPKNTNLFIELLRDDSVIYLARNDPAGSEKLLKAALAQSPKDNKRMALLTEFYVRMGQLTNALTSARQQLQTAPDDPTALFVEAILNMQLGHFAEALPSLDRLLKLQPDNNLARLNRAIIYRQTGKLAEAKNEYQKLRGLLPKTTYQIYFGLAKIAEQNQQTSEAVKNLKLYLQYAPTNSSEYLDARIKLKQLQDGKK